jgi:hypothetical protein
MTPQGQAGRWTIHGEGDLEVKGRLAAIRREGGIEEHELAPFELRLTVVSENPVNLTLSQTFSFHGGVVDFPHAR